MGAFPGNAVGRRFSDSVTGANHHYHIARQRFFCRHALQFGLFQRPVFNIKSFLCRQRCVFRNRFSASHYLNGTVIKLGRHPRLTLVFTPGNHANARNKNNRGTGVAHSRRIFVFAAFVISNVIFAILLQTLFKFVDQLVEIVILRIKVHQQWFNFGTQEMVRTRGAQCSQSWRIHAVYKT